MTGIESWPTPNSPILGTLRLLVIVDGRNVKQCQSILLCCRDTIERRINLLRRLGCVISWREAEGVFRVRDEGPFQLQKLRRMRFPPVKPREYRRYGPTAQR